MPRLPSHPSLPSVTEVLKDVGLTRDYPDTLAMHNARARGSALHQAIQWHIGGTLDESSLHEAIRPSFDKYQEFALRHGFVARFSELSLVHEPYGFVGTLDLVGEVDGELAVVDVKMSDNPDKAARWQLAGYGILWDHHSPGHPHVKRYVLPLGKTVKPEPIDVTDPYCLQVFAAALIIWRERQGVGR